MLLHSGAGLHGHEYCEQRHSPSPELQKKPLPFLRSALRTKSEPDYRHFSLPPTSSTATTGPSSTHGSSLPSSPVSLTSSSSPPRSPRLHRRADSDVIRKKDSSVRFRDPPMEFDHPPRSVIPSEDEESLAGSEFSDHVASSTRVKRRKRTTRTFTRFAFAHPAPALRNKQRRLVQIRPRLLLQLQQVGDKRAIPAFDVVPSSLLAGSLLIPLLARRFPRVFRKKPDLGQSDVLIVRSDDYGGTLPQDHQRSHDSGDRLDHRDVLAVISTLPQNDDQADIVLEDGSVWAANCMINGSYEFTRADAQGNVTTARWVRRNLPSPPVVPEEGNLPLESDRKWTFSIINPDTRRHPILGSLTPASLEIYDTYSPMSTSVSRFPPTRSVDLDAAFSGESSPTSPRITMSEERKTISVTEEERKVMMATAIWISLRQDGWPASANPKFAKTAAHCRTAGLRNIERARSFSGTCPLTGTTTGSSAPLESMGEQRTGSPIPRRSMSTGAAFMNNRRRLSALSLADSIIKEAPTSAPDEKTHTCRFRIRDLADRLFHRKGAHAQQESSLKHQIKE
ncbi:hypothetical protein HJFPF1_09188 [Paramyrothecium foliicola]|nr:hypothetical protein HJFPF1_09188 [Paramyrothecium foliicola]